MGSRKLTAVADAGPLIHLAEIGGLHFLSSFDTIHIPDAVWTETFGQGRLSQRDLSLIEKAEKYIADLYDVSSLFVTRAIVDLAIKQLRLSGQ